MNDDRKPRAGSMSDADRALQRRRSRGVVPVIIDDELTPPPQEPPRPDSIAGYDTLDARLQSQLDSLHAGQAQLVDSLGKLWPLRDESRLDRIERNVASIATSTTRHQSILDDMLVPQLDRWRATTDGIANQLPKVLGGIEALTITVTALDRQVRSLELEVRSIKERFDASSATTDERLKSAEAKNAALALRIVTLERNEHARTETSKALAKTERKKTGGLSAVVAAVVSAVAAAVSHLAK